MYQPWQNWPDLRRDCDAHVLVEMDNWPEVDRIDLIYEGIATGAANHGIDQSALRQNWPDLRRDCDFAHFGIADQSTMGTELTWFTKGLRLMITVNSIIIIVIIFDRIDLIYEGIATA